jgi:lysophospholipase L1-like esterase
MRVNRLGVAPLSAIILLVPALAFAARGVPLQAPAPAAEARHVPDDDLTQWEPEIAAFEASDRAHPPAPGGILFAGSSSIRMWTTLAEDFPGLPVLNRGFGGSQIHHVTAFVPRIVIPYQPKLIVFYCGTNDIASRQRTVDDVVRDYKEFVRTVRASLPHVRIAFISAAPNPSRWPLKDQYVDLNQRIKAYSDSDPQLSFIDIWGAMLGDNGKPRPELFIEDQLHMNAKGYAIWRDIVGKFLGSQWPLE